ncbi:MAG: hypothetical protein AAF491_09780 [Verrucomicrobiota bacterium]
MKKIHILPAFAALGLFVGCGDSDPHGHSHDDHDHSHGEHGHSHGDGGHSHEEHGHSHGDHDHSHGDGGHSHEDEDDHTFVALGAFELGGMSVGAFQGHGSVEAGKESHLVVKLPYSDKGETGVRAWIGTEDRTLSSVGKGEYSSSEDQYDVHAVAPDPLAEGSSWWIEIEKPDGSKVIGSIPFLKDV